MHEGVRASGRLLTAQDLPFEAGGGVQGCATGLQALIAQGNALAGDSWAASTRRRYAGAFRHLKEFCDTHGVACDLPLPAEILVAFAANLAQSMGVSALQGHMAAIVAAYAWLGLPHPFPRGSRMYRAFMGAAKLKAQPVFKVPGVPAEFIAALTQQQPRCARDIRDQCLLIFGWFVGMRAGNLVNMRHCEIRRTTGIGDWCLFIPQAKNDQTRRGRDVPLGQFSQDQGTPLYWIQRWATTSRAPPFEVQLGPHIHNASGTCTLFWDLRQGTKQLPNSIVQQALDAWCERLGIPANVFTTASLRVGCASALGNRAVPSNLRMLHCGWNSERVANGYVRLSGPQRLLTMTTLSEAVKTARDDGQGKG